MNKSKFIMLILMSIGLIFLAACESKTANTSSYNQDYSEKEVDSFNIEGIVLKKSPENMIIVSDLSREKIEGKSVLEVTEMKTRMYEVALNKVSTDAKVGNLVKIKTDGKFQETRISQTTAVEVEILE